MKHLVVSVVAVVAVCSLAASSFAAAQIGFNAIGPKLGFILPEDPIESTFGFGLESDLGTITPVIRLGAFLEYWSKGNDVGSYKWSWSDLAFGASGKYYFGQKGSLEPYAGAGLGLHRAKSEWEHPAWAGYYGATTYSVTNTEFGFHVMAGAEFEVGPKMKAFAELRYSLSTPDYLGIWGGVLYSLK